MSDSTKTIAEKLLWSRPEQKKQRGTIAIIGGNSQEFVDVQTAYAAAEDAGVGNVKVILPQSLKRLLGNVPGVEFAVATPSGSFASDALPSLMPLAQASDVTVLCGELSNNSETHVVTEKLAQQLEQPLVLVGDAIMHAANVLNERQALTVIIGAKPAIQELVKHYKLPETITNDSRPSQIRSAITELARAAKSQIVLHINGTVYIANGEEMHELDSDTMNHPQVAVYVAEMIAEFPNKPLDAVVASFYIETEE